jgi:hypothetical protein
MYFSFNKTQEELFAYQGRNLPRKKIADNLEDVKGFLGQGVQMHMNLTGLCVGCQMKNCLPNGHLLTLINVKICFVGMKFAFFKMDGIEIRKVLKYPCKKVCFLKK